MAVPLVDLVDETFVVADPAVVAERVHDPAKWREWWPDLDLTVFMDRGVQGMRWSVTGALVGSTEIWLEPWGDGVIVHWYLRADPTHRGSGTEPDAAAPAQPAAAVGAAASARAARRAERLRHHYAKSWKRHAFALKDELESGRPPGAGRR